MKITKRMVKECANQHLGRALTVLTASARWLAKFVAGREKHPVCQS